MVRRDSPFLSSSNSDCLWIPPVDITLDTMVMNEALPQTQDPSWPQGREIRSAVPKGKVNSNTNLFLRGMLMGRE